MLHDILGLITVVFSIKFTSTIQDEDKKKAYTRIFDLIGILLDLRGLYQLQQDKKEGWYSGFKLAFPQGVARCKTQRLDIGPFSES